MWLQKLILAMVFAACGTSAWAQYLPGQLVSGSLALDSKHSINLPQGDWIVAIHSRVALEEAWDVVILRNKLPFAPVQFLVLRQAAGSNGSRDISCATPHPRAMYSRNYRVPSTKAILQCSSMVALGPTFKAWANAAGSLPARWSQIASLIPASDWANAEAALLLENFIISPAGQAIEIDAIVQPNMLGMRAGDVQAAFESRQTTVTTVALKLWAKQLVASNTLGLFAQIHSSLEPLEEVSRVLALQSEEARMETSLAVDGKPEWRNEPTDAQEQARLGWAYRQGSGVVQDELHAFELFSRSAEQGSAQGKYGLAWMFADGAGVTRDESQAVQILTQLSEQGDFDSSSGLGQLYRDGRGVAKNEQRAFSYFEYAAQNGSALGQFNLGASYLAGSGTAKDDVRAAYWITKAANQGLQAALTELKRIPQDLRESANIRIAMATPNPAVASENEGKFLDAKREQDQEQVRLAAARQREADRLLEQMQAKLQEERLAELQKNAARERVAAEARQQQPQAARVAAAMKQQLEDEARVLQAQQKKLRENATAQTTKPEQQWYANRKALVIGNDDYQHVNKLANAVADAKAIGQSLEGLGYQVTLQLNLDEKHMKKSLRSFRESIQGGDEVLFYYAGHGTQIGASNYLLPIDIQGESENQVKDEAIQLQRILDDMSEQKAKFTLVVVDACRDNPFKVAGRSIGGRGLVPTSAATGQMVIFSAGSGQQALDNLGPNDKNPNGVFTRTFLKEILKPGVTVDRVLRNVRTQVIALAKSVGHEQTPALYDQADGDFYLSLPK